MRYVKVSDLASFGILPIFRTLFAERGQKAKFLYSNALSIIGLGMLHNDTLSSINSKNDCHQNASKIALRLGGMVALLAVIMSMLAGCATEAPEFPDMSKATNHTESVILREGDVVRVGFPSAPNLNATPRIQRDGTITLSLVGQITATGKTIQQLHEDLLKAYKDQIDSKTIDVELVAEEFSVFVTGAVLRPQKVTSTHPMTVLEACMECGGFDYSKANLTGVKVLRQDGKRLKSFTVDLKKVMKGHEQEQFYIQPLDIIYVPERFTWF